MSEKRTQIIINGLLISENNQLIKKDGKILCDITNLKNSKCSQFLSNILEFIFYVIIIYNKNNYGSLSISKYKNCKFLFNLTSRY